MKFLNKFLFVAVVSVGLYSCGDAAIKRELEVCIAERDSCLDNVRTNQIENEEDLKSGPSATYTFKLGDADSLGYNVSTSLQTIRLDSSIVDFYYIKNTGDSLNFPKGLVANLSEATVQLSINLSGKLVIKVFDEKHMHYTGGTGVDTFLVSTNKPDFKVSQNFHHKNGGKWIVGTEDPRPYVGRTKNHVFSRLSLGDAVRLSYVSTGGSTGFYLISSNFHHEGQEQLNCKKSVTGVPGWGLDFKKKCDL